MANDHLYSIVIGKRQLDKNPDLLNMIVDIQKYSSSYQIINMESVFGTPASRIVGYSIEFNMEDIDMFSLILKYERFQKRFGSKKDWVRISKKDWVKL